MEITYGTIKSAQKVVLYGPEGIGKSTFASRFPEPLFIDTEGGTKKLNVARLPAPTSWSMIFEEVRYVINNPSICKTLVVDTADWAEQHCSSHVCSTAKVNGIEDFGYGKGYVYLSEEFGKLLNLLNDVIEKNINVVITAHAKIRKFEQPDEIGSYDRWEMKLTKNVAPLVKEWADMILFANYKTYVIATDEKGKKHKAQGGERVMYTSHHSCWDAKNRDGLPEELPFDYAKIAHCIPDFTAVSQTNSEIVSNQSKALPDDFIDLEPYIEEKAAEIKAENSELDKLPKALADLMRVNNVSCRDIQWAVSDKGYYPIETPVENYDSQFIEGVLIGAWEQVFAIIKEHNKLPF